MIRKRIADKEMIVNIDGPDGNAFHLIGIAVTLGRDTSMKEDEIKHMKQEMMEGNYINLLKIFEEYWVEYVVLETKNEEYLKEMR